MTAKTILGTTYKMTTTSDLQNLEMTYSRLYELSVQIGQLIDRKLYSELITFMTKKEKLLKDAEELVQKLQNQKVNIEKLTEICTKYQNQEIANIQALTMIRDDIKKELSKASKDSKLLNAYSANKELKQGNILDYRQ